MNEFILRLNGYLWGFPMIALLCCTHLFLTFRTGIIQRKLSRGISMSLCRTGGSGGDISPFSALATSLASTIGTGNIIGVGTAVAMGGAGAVFWCWLTGVLGIATQYAEAFLSVKYRDIGENGEYTGGTMYALQNGVGSRGLACLYAAVAATVGLLTGAVIQSNAIGTVISNTLNDRDIKLCLLGSEISLSAAVSGLVTAVLTALVILGGIRSVGRVCEYMVPIMALLYMMGCVAVMIANRRFIIESLLLIITSAFSPRAALSGAAGGGLVFAMRYGISRGLLSNEAGLGTSTILAASADSRDPVSQGLVSMTATFWDTVVMCLVTGVTVVSTVISEGIDLVTTDGGTLCLVAFSRIGVVGRAVLVIGMTAFAFSTILGWSCVGLRCAVFVFSKRVTRLYRTLWILAVAVSPLLSLELVWNISDLCNALLAIPNVLSLLMLSGEVRRETARYIGGSGENKKSPCKDDPYRVTGDTD